MSSFGPLLNHILSEVSYTVNSVQQKAKNQNSSDLSSMSLLLRKNNARHKRKCIDNKSQRLPSCLNLLISHNNKKINNPELEPIKSSFNHTNVSLIMQTVSQSPTLTSWWRGTVGSLTCSCHSHGNSCPTALVYCLKPKHCLHKIKQMSTQSTDLQLFLLNYNRLNLQSPILFA